MRPSRVRKASHCLILDGAATPLGNRGAFSLHWIALGREHKVKRNLWLAPPIEEIGYLASRQGPVVNPDIIHCTAKLALGFQIPSH